MHSRSFLHRTTTTPRAGVTQDGPDGRFPLGFADVRGIVAGDAPVQSRAPIGFAPTEPQFVTELSFRRVPSRAEAHDSTSDTPASVDSPLGVGHAAGWRPADAPVGAVAPEQSEPTPTAPVAEVPTEDNGTERVPFYKREISLRRRKRSEVESPDSVEPVGEVVPGDHDEHDSDEQPERTIGFAAPVEGSEDEDVVAVEVESVEAPLADAEDEAAPVAVDDPEDEKVLEDPVALDEEDVVDGPGEDSVEDLVAADAYGTDIVDAEIEEITVVEAEVPEVASADVVADEITVVEAGASEEAVVAEEVADADELAAEQDANPPAPAPIEVAAAAESSGRRRSIRARRGAGSAPKESAPKGGRGRKVVGLKIGASQIAAAVVTRTNGEDELVGLARMALEPGIVVDGEVRDPEALTEALQSFFDENKLPRRDVYVGVASNRIGVRTVDISGIDDQDRFDNAVRFKAHEVLPVSFSESVLDYRVVEERATENGDLTKRVLLVVAPKDQVEPFVTACDGAGVKLAGVDLEALGLLRAFVAPQQVGQRLSTDTATVVVAIGHESTTLLVSGGGTCEFTRVFDWGGHALQQAIAQELDIHTIEATTILHGLSLVGPGRSDLDEGMRARALDAVRTRLTPFARELISSLQFYQAQAGSLGIGEIVITGGTSKLEGLADALHQMIGVSVRVGDPLQRLSIAHPIDPEHAQAIGSFAVPVGLAIADDAARGVNLLPDDHRRQRRKKPGMLQIALPVAAVVPLAAFGLLFMQANGDASAQQSDLAAVQAQIDTLPEPPHPQIDASLAVEQQQRATALATVLGGRLAWDRVLGDLSRVLPANVWLTKFTAQTPQEEVLPTAAAVSGQPAGATLPPTPTGVTIEGYTYSVPDVARVLSRLGAVPSLTNVVLGSTEEREVGKRKAIAFTIVADIDGNGGAK